jgi:DNA-directed RNA polymerase subunit RPC12/RpoP
MKCADCGKTVDPLDIFPKDRCLDCHAKATQHMTATMTADKLARMWGYDPRRKP